MLNYQSTACDLCSL